MSGWLKPLFLSLCVTAFTVGCSSVVGGLADKSTTSGSNAVVAPAGAEVLSLDTAVPTCPGATDTRLSVLALDRGATFWSVFPSAGKAQELSAVNGSLLVVVYKDGYPGELLGTVLPNGVGQESRARVPNTVDVCVATADGQDAFGGPRIIYGNVPVQGSIFASP